MKNFVTLFISLGILLLAASPSFAGSTSVGLKTSTLGGGIEIEQNFNDTFGGRLGLNAFTYNYDGTKDDIAYDLDLDLFSVAALLDWHPFSGSFRVTAGGLYNDNQLNAISKPAGTYTIGDATYTAAQVGTLNGTIDFEDIAAYTGIGWNTTFDNEEAGWGFIADLGVVFQGTPQTTLTADGTLSGDPTFQSNLAKEQQNLQDDLDEFKFYPVIAVGVAYRF